MKKYLLILFVISAILISGCAKEDVLKKFQKSFGNPNSFHISATGTETSRHGDIETESEYTEEIIFQKPNFKFYFRDFKLYTGAEKDLSYDNELYFICVNGVLTRWVKPDKRVWSIRGAPCSTVGEYQSSEFLSKIEKVLSLEPELAGIENYNGRPALKVSINKRESVGKVKEVTKFDTVILTMLLDPVTYFPLKYNITKLYYHEEGREEEIFENTSTATVIYDVFEVNKEYPAEVFALPEELRNLPVCESGITFEETNKLQEEYDKAKEVMKAEGKDLSKLSKEDFEYLENIGMKFTANLICSDGYIPPETTKRSYEDYLASGSSWY